MVRVKLLEASEKMLLALKLKNIPDLKEQQEEFELAVIEEQECLIRSKVDTCTSELSDLGKRRMELWNKIDERKKEREEVRGRK